MTKTTRNLVIFSAVTLSAGWIGAGLDRLLGTTDPQQSLGMLLLLVAPLGTGLLLRAMGGDGWQGLGLRPKLLAAWRWYVVALLSFPLVSLVALVLGSALGVLSLPGFQSQGLGAAARLIGAGFGSVLVKNLFEEFAWRGYLTPQFARLELHPLLGHLLTGLVWGGWHLSYWFVFLDPATFASFTSLSVPAFAALGISIMVVTAVPYGELRLLSGSVWPAVLLHCVANAVSLALLSGGFVEVHGLAGVVFSPGNDGVFGSLLFALLGLGLYAYRTRWRQARGTATPASIPAQSPTL